MLPATPALPPTSASADFQATPATANVAPVRSCPSSRSTWTTWSRTAASAEFFKSGRCRERQAVSVKLLTEGVKAVFYLRALVQPSRFVIFWRSLKLCLIGTIHFGAWLKAVTMRISLVLFNWDFVTKNKRVTVSFYTQTLITWKHVRFLPFLLQ